MPGLTRFLAALELTENRSSQLSSWAASAADAVASLGSWRRVLAYSEPGQAGQQFEVVHVFRVLPEVAIADLAAAERRLADSVIHLELLDGDLRGDIAQSLAPDSVTSIEFIDVHDGAAEEYARTMAGHCIPAMQVLIDKEIAQFFLPMHRSRVMRTMATVPAWSEVHLLSTHRGVSPAAFERALDQALLEVDPGSNGCAGVFGRLSEIRTKPRWDFYLSLCPTTEGGA